MTDPTVDRVIAILREARSVALPLAELARHLGGDVDMATLAGRLAPDPRLRVLDAGGFPSVACPDADRAAAYERALRAAGLRADRRVVLIEAPMIPTDAGIGALLRSTAALLLAPGDADALAGPAERAARALRATLLEAP